MEQKDDVINEANSQINDYINSIFSEVDALDMQYTLLEEMEKNLEKTELEFAQNEIKLAQFVGNIQQCQTTMKKKLQQVDKSNTIVEQINKFVTLTNISDSELKLISDMHINNDVNTLEKVSKLVNSEFVTAIVLIQGTRNEKDQICLIWKQILSFKRNFKIYFEQKLTSINSFNDITSMKAIICLYVQICKVVGEDVQFTQSIENRISKMFGTVLCDIINSPFHDYHILMPVYSTGGKKYNIAKINPDDVPQRYKQVYGESAVSYYANSLFFDIQFNNRCQRSAEDIKPVDEQSLKASLTKLFQQKQIISAETLQIQRFPEQHLIQMCDAFAVKLEAELQFLAQLSCVDVAHIQSVLIKAFTCHVTSAVSRLDLCGCVNSVQFIHQALAAAPNALVLALSEAENAIAVRLIGVVKQITGEPISAELDQLTACFAQSPPVFRAQKSPFISNPSLEELNVAGARLGAALRSLKSLEKTRLEPIFRAVLAKSSDFVDWAARQVEGRPEAAGVMNAAAKRAMGVV